MRSADLLRLAAATLVVLSLTACAPAPANAPTVSPAPPTSSPLPTKTVIPTNTPTATEVVPQTLVFYGDSVLKVGEVGRQGEVGFSFVDDLRPALEPPHTLVTANYGGKNARWAAANLEKSVLDLEPDAVTLWWGMNELYGCPGIFDRSSNQLIPYMLDAYVNEHTRAMRQMVDTLTAKNIPVYVMTPMPVLNELPWSHFDENNVLVWENDRWCDYNLGLEQIAAADRALVDEYAAAGYPVHLVDIWQVYQENAGADKMYMDTMHPASHGAALIAATWLRVFEASQR